MKNTLILLCAIAALTSFCCTKDKLDDIELINFGYVNFAWGPNCQIYQLSAEHLYKPGLNTCDPRDTTTVVYDIMLPAEKYALAKRLYHELPAGIYTTKETNFVTLSADAGEYFLEIKKGDTVKKVYFTGVLNEEWPEYARKTYLLLEQVVRDIKP